MLIRRQEVRVTVAADGFSPQRLHWQSRSVRVLAVEGVQTRGLERWYRLRTVEGRCDVIYRLGAGDWLVQRAPTWWDRLWARIQHAPRYPLPAWQRRRARPAGRQSAAVQQGERNHAVRLALVRQ